MPVVGSNGEECEEAEFGTLRLLEVEDGEVALAGGGDVEVQSGELVMSG